MSLSNTTIFWSFPFPINILLEFTLCNITDSLPQTIFFFNCYTSHKDFSSSLFFLSFLSFLSPFFLRAVCLYDVGRLLIVPEFCPPTVLERPASQMSFLEQFLKETSLRRQGSLESEEGDVEDNRAPSVPSIASSHSFVSQVGLVHETIGF